MHELLPPARHLSTLQHRPAVNRAISPRLVKTEPGEKVESEQKPSLITQWTPLTELKASVVCGDRIGVLKLRSFDVHLPPLSPAPSKNFTVVELVDGCGRVVHLVGKGRMNAVLHTVCIGGYVRVENALVRDIKVLHNPSTLVQPMQLFRVSTYCLRPNLPPSYILRPPRCRISHFPLSSTVVDWPGSVMGGPAVSRR